MWLTSVFLTFSLFSLCLTFCLSCLTIYLLTYLFIVQLMVDQHLMRKVPYNMMLWLLSCCFYLLCVCLSAYLFLSFYFSFCVFVKCFTCPIAKQEAFEIFPRCLFLFVCVHLCLYVCLFLSIFIYFYGSFCLSSLCLTFYLTAYLSLFLSVFIWPNGHTHNVMLWPFPIYLSSLFLTFPLSNKVSVK